MSITLQDLSTRFKASGVYTIYEDNTVNANTTTNTTLRLIVGFSKYGVFNRPVFIKKGDFAAAENLFGPRDKTLERQGSWFHKSLKTALAESDILALNLLHLNNEVDLDTNIPTDNADVVQYKSFSLDIAAENGTPTDKLYASYYNKQRFWIADKAYLLATRKTGDQGKLFNLVNLSQTPCSFIIRKSDVRGFDITVKEWYQSKDIPKYLKPYDFISDYFIDVICVNGKFGPDNYSQLSTDPVFGKYFDQNGLKTALLDEFLNLQEVSVRAIFTGSIIPGFKDKDGSAKGIEDIINGQINRYNILCAIDRKELDKFEYDTNTYYVDMVGHRLLSESVESVNFLSYKKRIVQDYEAIKKTSNSTATLSHPTGLTITYSPRKITIVVSSTNTNFTAFKNNVELGTLFQGVTTATGSTNGITVSNPVLEVTRVLKTDTSVTFDLYSPLKDTETATSGVFVDFDQTAISPETAATITYTVTNAGSAGNIATIKIDKGAGAITLGTYTVQSGDTTSNVATGLKNNVNANTTSGTAHGFTAGSSSAVVTVTAPAGNGANANSWTGSRTVTGSLAITAQATMSGGITEINELTYETTNDRFYLDGTDSYYVADKGSDIYQNWANGELTNGDKIVEFSSGTPYYLKFTEVFANDGIDTVDDFRKILKIELFTDSDLTTPISSGQALDFGETADSFGFEISDATKIIMISAIGKMNERFAAVKLTDNSVRIPIAYVADVKNGQYLVGFDADGNEMLTRITSIKRYGSPSVTHIDVETANKVKIFTAVDGSTMIERFIPFESYMDRYDVTMLPGFTLKTTHIPNNTNERMKEILDVMFNTNLSNALADPEMISFRYFVDTFNHGLETTSKLGWSRLAMKRQKCIALLNTPSFAEFSESSNPRFTTTPTAAEPVPNLNMEYIYSGGNLDENPSFLYTLPQAEDGGSFVGFFAPNLKYLDSGEEISVPPAALVSNNFVRKFTSGANPFKPVAGKQRGVLTDDGLIDVEYPLFKEDRGFLEEKGINPIIRKKDGTIMIYGTETAYKRFKSVLNNLHVRDMLITVETDSEGILDNYVFEFQDDTMRIEIFGLLDNYLGGLARSFGCIKDNYEIIFDSSNNPAAVVRENTGIVDVVIEPTGVFKKFINRITLIKDGPVTSGGFVAI